MGEDEKHRKNCMFIDPIRDCPDKLIWALCGWLAWNDEANIYSSELKELNKLIDYRLAQEPQECD